MADRERRPRLCTPEWTLLAYSQCAGGHHGAGFNWRRRCDDLLAVPRWDRAVGPELVSVWRGGPAAARCARALGCKMPSRAVETCPAMRRESHPFMITEPFPGYSGKRFRDHERGGPAVGTAPQRTSRISQQGLVRRAKLAAGAKAWLRPQRLAQIG